MKKNMVLIACLIACLIMGCGAKTTSTDATVEASKHWGKSWMEENGFSVVPQGDYILHTSQNDGHEDTGLADIPIHVEMYESTDGVEPGMKNIVYKLVFDTSTKTDWDIEWIDYLIDRETGKIIYYSLSEDGESFDPSLPIPIEINGKTYEAYYSVDPTYNYQDHVYTFVGTLTCPESYDGVVFQVGYYDKTLSSQMHEMYTNETFPRCLNEFIGFEEHKDTYYFFSVTDK